MNVNYSRNRFFLWLAAWAISKTRWESHCLNDDKATFIEGLKEFKEFC